MQTSYRALFVVLVASLSAPALCRAQQLEWSVGGAQNEQIGRSLAAGFDHDGDGAPDLLVGAIGFSSQVASFATVRRGSDGAPLSTLTWSTFADQVDVAVAGDVDLDGRVDYLVGLADDSTVAYQAGRVILFSGATGAPLQTHFGDAANHHLGISVAGGVDLDADGVPDLIAGAGSNPGSVRLFSGATGLATTIAASVLNGGFGLAVAAAPDVDGDGHDDLLVGATYEDGPGPNPLEGSVRLYSGKSLTPLLTVFGHSVQMPIGRTVAAVGDVDGDLVPDFATTGAYGTLAGRTVWFSGSTGAELFEAQKPAGLVESYGVDLAPTPDFDGDGRPDLVVGSAAPNWMHEGAMRVLSGKDGATLLEVRSGQSHGEFGRAVAGLGDVDGRLGFAVGAYGSSSSANGSGRVDLYVTSSCAGVESVGPPCVLGGLPPLELTLEGCPEFDPTVTLDLAREGPYCIAGALVLVGTQPGTLAVLPSCGVLPPPWAAAFPLPFGCPAVGLPSAITCPLPPVLPVGTTYFQAFVPEPASPLGFEGSNVLAVTTG